MRHLMTMRCLVERSEPDTDTTDIHGHPGRRDPDTIYAELPCYVWAQPRQITEDTGKVVTVEEWGMISAKGSPVKEGDVVKAVVNRRGDHVFGSDFKAVIKGSTFRLDLYRSLLEVIQ